MARLLAAPPRLAKSRQSESLLETPLSWPPGSPQSLKQPKFLIEDACFLTGFQAFIGKAFLIAVALVFLVMVAQFNSVFQPVLVLIGIILAIGGVFWGLLIVNVTFAFIMSGVGIVALAGVVAKNSIILIDFTNHLRREGMEVREAVIEAGKTRMRPVILTALTAMIGLLPMATGIGFDFTHLELVTRAKTSMFWGPMAWSIFWGLLFNTFLVLIATPTFYLAYVQIGEWLKRKTPKFLLPKPDVSANH